MRVLDFIFALRPLVLVPAWSFFLLGFGATAGADFPAQRFLLLSAVLAAVHLVNQVADRDSDRINAKGFFLQRGIFRPRTYVVAALALLAGALGVAFVDRAAPWRLAAAAALGLAYSVPPLRFCARPGLDVVANACGYGGLATWIGAGDGAIAGPWAARLAACMLAVAAVFLHTTLLDVTGDARTGKHTTGSVLGCARTRALAAAAAVTASLLAAFAASPLLLGACVPLALLALAAWGAPHRVTSVVVSVGGTTLFAIAASVQMPLFAVALGGLVLLTRAYYARRFALAYPSLRSAAVAPPDTATR